MEKTAGIIKRITKSIFGIVLIAGGVLSLLAFITAVIEPVRNAKYYNTAVTGTVIDSVVSRTGTTISSVTIQYDALNGKKNTIVRPSMRGEYHGGEEIALRCPEDKTDAVLETETHLNPGILATLFFLTLLFGAFGCYLLFASPPKKETTDL